MSKKIVQKDIKSKPSTNIFKYTKNRKINKKNKKILALCTLNPFNNQKYCTG